jgi:hypothetical protein
MSTAGFITWGGGECPVKAGTLVDIRFRNWRVIEGTLASDWLWGRPVLEPEGAKTAHRPGNDGVIVAYRELETAQ